MSAILLVILVMVTLIQLGIWLWLFGCISNDESKITSDKPSVTLVIAIKNELDNLKNHLDTWLRQDYPRLDVIIVDDGSDDGSHKYIEEQLTKYANLSLLNNQYKSGKKGAMQTGIEQAGSAWIATTDADCKPASNAWISNVMAHKAQAEVILAYGPYNEAPSLLNKFIRYETWYIAMQYLSLARKNLPYMGVGRNLFYTKQAFNNAGAYDQHQHLKSGDDDLLIRDVSQTATIGINVKDYTYSIPATSWWSLIQQKRRHLTTATNYRYKHKSILSIFFISQLAFYICVISLCCTTRQLTVVLSLVILRSLVMLIVANNKMSLLSERKLWYWTPFLDFLLTIYYTFMGAMMLVKKQEW